MLLNNFSSHHKKITPTSSQFFYTRIPAIFDIFLHNSGDIFANRYIQRSCNFFYFRFKFSIYIVICAKANPLNKYMDSLCIYSLKSYSFWQLFTSSYKLIILNTISRQFPKALLIIATPSIDINAVALKSGNLHRCMPVNI